MSVLEDKKAEINQAVADTKTAIAAMLADKDARVADAEKKYEDAAASAVSSDDLAWLDQLVVDIKGIIPT